MSQTIRTLRALARSSLAALPVTHEATIAGEHLDAMGHMNVRWYADFFSKATGTLFRSVGLTRDYMEGNRGGTFVLESHIRYLSEILEGQKVLVHTRLIGRSSKRFQVMHFMWNDGTDVLSATVDTLIAHIDLRRRRMAPLPEEIGEKMDEMLKVHEGLDWAPPTCGSIRP